MLSVCHPLKSGGRLLVVLVLVLSIVVVVVVVQAASDHHTCSFDFHFPNYFLHFPSSYATFLARSSFLIVFPHHYPFPPRHRRLHSHSTALVHHWPDAIQVRIAMVSYRRDDLASWSGHRRVCRCGWKRRYDGGKRKRKKLPLLRVALLLAGRLVGGDLLATERLKCVLEVEFEILTYLSTITPDSGFLLSHQCNVRVRTTTRPTGRRSLQLTGRCGIRSCWAIASR